MRIVYISKYAKTPKSGGRSRQYLLSKNLASNGHNMLLICSRSNGSKQIPFFIRRCIKEKDGDLEALILRGPKIKLGFNLKRVWSWLVFELNLFLSIKTIRRFKPDLIIVSSLSILTFLFGIYYKRRYKIPLVLEIRDLYPLTLIEIGNFSRRNPFIKILSAIEKAGYKEADIILSSLENTKAYIEEIAGRKIIFKWVPTGFDGSLFSNISDEKYNIVKEKIRKLKTSGKFIIGYAGSIGKANALDEVFELTNHNNIIENHIHFVFIGNGPLKNYYLNKYGNSGVTFIDPVPREVVPQILCECDILINTWLKRTIYQYGINPNKWIDYMYSGRPVLLAHSYESNIFKEGKFGWQVTAQDIKSIEDMVVKISKMPKEEIDLLGENGKNYLMEKLNYKTIAKNLEDGLNLVVVKG